MKKTAEEIINESIEKRRKKEEEKKKLVEKTKNKEIEPSIEETKVETEQDIFVAQSKSFLWSMLKSGRSRMTADEAKKLEDIYNRTFGLAENIKNCDLCCIRVWKRCCNYYGVK